MLRVTGAHYPEPGKRHIYFLCDGSQVIESPEYPGKSRWQFWNNMNRSVLNKSEQAAMKAAVEQHKKRWGCK